MINREAFRSEPQRQTLRRLTLHDLCIKSGTKFFDHLLRPLGQLTHLDLSSAFHAQGMQRWVNMARMMVMMVIIMIMTTMMVMVLRLFMPN